MKIKRVDEMRAIACILVLAFHAVGSEPQLRGTALAYLAASLRFVRMPVFISITGLLYGLSRKHQPLNMEGWRKRVGRLLAPFVLCSFIICLLDQMRGAGFHPVRALAFGAWHLWYLPALAMILLIVVALERLVELSSKRLWVAASIAALISATHIANHINLFAFSRAVSLLPFFLAGAAIGSSRDRDVPILGKVLIFAAGFMALVVHQFSLNGVGAQWQIGSLVSSALGLFGFLLVGSLAPASQLLRSIGIHSLPIFLWHLPIFAVLSGLLLHRFQVEPHVAFLVKIVVGVCLSMLFADEMERRLPALAPYIGARNQRRRLADQRREAEAFLSASATTRATTKP